MMPYAFVDQIHGNHFSRDRLWHGNSQQRTNRKWEMSFLESLCGPSAKSIGRSFTMSAGIISYLRWIRYTEMSNFKVCCWRLLVLSSHLWKKRTLSSPFSAAVHGILITTQSSHSMFYSGTVIYCQRLTFTECVFHQTPACPSSEAHHHSRQMAASLPVRSHFRRSMKKCN